MSWYELVWAGVGSYGLVSVGMGLYEVVWAGMAFHEMTIQIQMIDCGVGDVDVRSNVRGWREAFAV